MLASLGLPDGGGIGAPHPEQEGRVPVLGTPMRPELSEWPCAVKEECRRQKALVIELAASSAEVDAHPEVLSADGFHPRAHG